MMDPTSGLDRPARTALCDASYGLLGLIDGLYRRQTTRPVFEHARGTIDALVARGLMKGLGNGVVQITPVGRRVASRIHQHRIAIAAWDRKARAGR